jgi:cell division protein ZapA (FtsZ GTPase activity inhibitor)
MNNVAEEKMKQKFTITIADIEMNILSEGTSEDVEAIVNKVDRRIREICLRSPRISKNEAALLCALEFCSERDIAQRELSQRGDSSETLKEENARLTDTLDKLTAKVEALKDKYESAAAAQKEKYESAAATQKEKYEGRIQIMKEKYEARINSLRQKLEEFKKSGSAQQQLSLDFNEENDIDTAPDDATLEAPEENSAPAEKMAAEIKTERTEDKNTITDSAKTFETAPSATAADDGNGNNKKDARSKGKNKVGSMFDLLTFNDV